MVVADGKDMEKKEKTQKARTFNKGMGNLKCKHYQRFRVEYMNLFDITSRVAFNNHLRGIVRRTPAEEIAIETLFAKYGVGKNDIWD